MSVDLAIQDDCRWPTFVADSLWERLVTNWAFEINFVADIAREGAVLALDIFGLLAPWITLLAHFLEVVVETFVLELTRCLL